LSTKLIQATQNTNPTSTTLHPQPVSQHIGLTAAPMAICTVGTDDGQSGSNSNLVPLEETTATITPKFITQWNTFYSEFDYPHGYQCNDTLMLATATIDDNNDEIVPPGHTMHSLPTDTTMTTLQPPCPSSPALFASMQMTHPTKTHNLPQPAPPNKSPMTVPMSTVTQQSPTTAAQLTDIVAFLSKLDS